MMESQESNVHVVETAQEIWGLSLQPAGCSHCGQAYLVDEKRTGIYCPNCAQAVLNPQPARLRGELPEKIIPFQVQHAGLKTIFTEFVKGVWLKFDDFNVESLLNRAVPVFIPMWLVDSDISGTWQGEMGYDYQVKSSQEYYGSGGWRTREHLETRVSWEPRLGQVQRHYDNALTPGLSDHDKVMARLGAFAMKQAVRYTPEQLGEAVLRVPDLQAEQAWPIGREILGRRVAQHCQKAAGAQHYRSFDAKLDYDSLHWTQLLLPMYYTYYSDDEGRHHPVFVNGQSGAVSGVRLASQRKGWKWAGITAAIAVFLFLLTLGSFALGTLFPPVAAIGVVMVLLALLAGIGAVVPAVWPWQWNRRQLGISVKESG